MRAGRWGGSFAGILTVIRRGEKEGGRACEHGSHREQESQTKVFPVFLEYMIYGHSVQGTSGENNLKIVGN